MIRRLLQKIKSKARQGKAFETMTRAALKRLADNPKNQLWFQRIWDFRSFMRLNRNFRVIRQPADFMATCRGIFHLIECKSTQANRLDMGNLRPHQFEAMVDVTKAGGFYWILVLKRGESLDKHRLFVFNLDKWLALKREIEQSRFMTADWNLVEKTAYMELFRSSGVWDLAPLFGIGDINDKKKVK